MGDLEFEPEAYPPERIRAQEQIAAAAGRTRYTTVAQAPDGECVAYTELVVPAHDPGRVYQWGTLVAPGHRGHRLGLAVKVHNLRWLQQERPDLRFVTTFNAEVNRPMIEVNERMGFRPVERSAELKLQL
jgi:RimJ/RimL family protein N-acetyltransferase